MSLPVVDFCGSPDSGVSIDAGLSTFGLPGSFDAEGRLAAIAAPLICSGFAWAAILAGVVVGRWGLTTLPIVTEIGMLVCAALLFAGTSKPRLAKA